MLKYNPVKPDEFNLFRDEVNKYAAKKYIIKISVLLRATP